MYGIEYSEFSPKLYHGHIFRASFGIVTSIRLSSNVRTCIGIYTSCAREHHRFDLSLNLNNMRAMFFDNGSILRRRAHIRDNAHIQTFRSNKELRARTPFSDNTSLENNFATLLFPGGELYSQASFTPLPSFVSRVALHARLYNAGGASRNRVFN